jgi:hypothetical protein
MLGSYRVYDADAHVILERPDVTEFQKQKILYDNPVRFFGEP